MDGEVRMDASRRQGLNAGDLVAFVRVDDTGGGGARPMRVLCESREDEGGEERATWALVEDGEDEHEAEESPWERDRACWLEVVRKENWIGFRSATAGGRFLQVRRRGRRRLSFFNTNFGIWEQFEFAHGEPKISWNKTKMFFRSRQLHGFVLTVEVVRVGDLASPAVDAPDGAYEATPASRRASLCPGGIEPDSAASEESVHGSVFRAMGSILAKEWSSFAEREVNSRNAIEKELKELNINLAETRDWAAGYVQDMREKLQNGVNECLKEVNMAYDIVDGCKAKENQARNAAGAMRGLAIRLLTQRKRRHVLVQAFGIWKEDAGRARLCRRYQELLTHRRLANALRLSFRDWADKVARVRVLQLKLEQHIHGHDLRIIRSSFRVWAAALGSQGMSAAHRLMRAAAFHIMFTTRRVFEEWQLWVAECRARQEHFLFAIACNSRTRMRFVMRDWRQHVRIKADAARFEAFAKRKTDKVRMRGYLRHWLAMRGSDARELRLRAMADAKRARTLGSQVFFAWALLIRVHRSRRYVLAKYLLRASSRKVRTIFAVWMQETTGRRLKLRSSYRIVSMIVFRAVSAAFKTWKDATRDAHRHGTLLSMIARIEERSNTTVVRSHFDRWVTVTMGSSSRGRVTADGAVLKVARMRMARVLAAWSGEILTARRLRHVLGIIRSKIDRRSCAVALRALSAHAAQQRRRRMIVARTERRRAARMVLCAFSDWIAAVEDSIARRMKLMEKVHRLEMHAKSKTFQAWLDVLHTSSCDDDMVTVTSETLIIQMRRRMRRLACKRCFASWQSFSARQRALRVSIVRMVTHWRKHSVRKSFECWLDYATTRRYQRGIVSRTLTRMIHRRMGSAFVTWFDVAREATVARRKLDAFVHRWMNTRTLVAFNAWFERAMRKADARCKASAILHVLRGDRLEIAMATWRGNVVELTRRRELLSRFTSRMRNSQIIPAFSMWLDSAGEQRDQRHRSLAYLLAVNRRRCLRSTFDAIRRVVHDFKAARKLCSDVFAKRMLGNLQVAFGIWHDESVLKKEMRAKMTTVVHRMTSRKLAAAFNSWMDLIHVARSRRALLARAAAKLMNLALHASWNKWCIFASESVHYRCVLMRATVRMTKRCLSGAFIKWKDDVRFEKRTRIIVERWTGRSNRALLEEMLGAWQHTVANKKRIQRVADKVLKRVVFGALSSTFTAWTDTVKLLQHSRRIADESFRRKATHLTSRAFWAFCNACREKSRNAAMLMRACRRIQRMSSSTYFKEWLGVVQQRRWYAMKLSQKAERDRMRYLTFAMASWLDCMYEKMEQLNTVSACVKRKQTAQRFFLSWYWDAFDSDIQSALSELMEARDVTIEKSEDVAFADLTTKELPVVLSPLPTKQAPFDVRSGLRGTFEACDLNGDEDVDGEFEESSFSSPHPPNWETVAEITI